MESNMYSYEAVKATMKSPKKDLIPNKSNIKSLLNISIPITTSRLIGTFGYFL